MMNALVTPGNLRSQRNQLRTTNSRKQVVGSTFIGPLPQGTRRVRGARQTGQPSGQSQATASAPLNRATRTVARNASVRTTANGTVFVNEECIAEISGSTTFSILEFDINPGLASFVPWLAARAQGFDRHAWLTLYAKFVSLDSASDKGEVLMAFTPDASDTTPASAVEMLALRTKGSKKIWEDWQLTIPVNDLRNTDAKYIRSGNVANTDKKTYDVGRLYFATNACSDTSIRGRLYIGYRCHVEDPVLNITSVATAESINITSGGTVSKTAFFGTAPTTAGGLLVVPSAMTITFNLVGQFLVVLDLAGTVLTYPTLTGTAASSYATMAISVGTNSTAFVCAILVTVTALGQTLVFTDGGSSTVTSANARIADRKSVV